MLTKGDLLDAAFGDIGLASYVFDLEADEQERALRSMDSYMAMLSIKGIRVGYQLSEKPSDSSLNQLSGLPAYAIDAVTKNVALRLAPLYNKMPSQDLRNQAKEAYNALLTAVSTIPSMQNTSILPTGAGNRYNRRLNNTFYKEQDTLTANNSTLDLDK